MLEYSGENFSSRIWTDKRKLSKVIKETITSGIHQGLDVKEMSRRINDVMSSGYNNAVRLVRTEMNFVNNSATYDALDEVGILYYEFIAVLDNRTSKMCQSRDGEVYPMSEKSVGFNFPPLHPRCRSTVAPYIEGSGRLGSRVGKVNGKRLHVPETMNYQEFKEKYLTDTVKEDRIQGALNSKNDPDGTRREAHAKRYYESIRNSKPGYLIKRISQRSQTSEKAVKTVIEHVFLNKHNLDGEIEYFYPSYYMSESIRRLSEGKNIQSHDLILLKHEWLEAHLMKRYNYDYRRAHDVTERKYNYRAALDEWRKRNEPNGIDFVI